MAVYLLAEFAALVGLVLYIGIGWTILIFLATGLIGALLLRVNGVKAMRIYREAVLENRPPGPAAVTGVLGVTGAVLLLLPGVITDIAGLLCVLPGTRALLRPLVTRFLERRMDSPTMNRFFGPRVVHTPGTHHHRRPDPGFTADDVIDGEVIDDDVTGDRQDGPARSQDDEGPKPLT